MLKEKNSFAYDNKGFMLLYFNKCAELLIHTRQTLDKLYGSEIRVLVKLP